MATAMAGGGSAQGRMGAEERSGGRRQLEAAAVVAGLAAHEAAGEGAPAMGVVLTPAGSSRLLLGAVGDAPVAVHHQLSGAARHADASLPRRPGAGALLASTQQAPAFTA